MEHRRLGKIIFFIQQINLLKRVYIISGAIKKLSISVLTEISFQSGKTDFVITKLFVRFEISKVSSFKTVYLLSGFKLTVIINIFLY